MNPEKLGGEQSPPDKPNDTIEPHYVVINDGVLEKHINTKSDYLVDMMGLDLE